MHFLGALHARGQLQPIFAKSYVYQPVQVKTSAQDAPAPSNFFAGLPQLTLKELKLKGHAPAKSKGEVLAKELAKLKDKNLAQQKNIAFKEAALTELNQRPALIERSDVQIDAQQQA